MAVDKKVTRRGIPLTADDLKAIEKIKRECRPVMGKITTVAAIRLALRSYEMKVSA